MILECMQAGLVRDLRWGQRLSGLFRAALRVCSIRPVQYMRRAERSHSGHERIAQGHTRLKSHCAPQRPFTHAGATLKNPALGLSRVGLWQAQPDS